MIFSKPILETDNMNTRLNWWEYWVGHCWMTGWQSIRSTFQIWCDLMSSQYKDYALLPKDDPEQECKEWFWVSLGEDDTYPKEFLEYLMEMAYNVETGKEELILVDEDFMNRLKELVKDVELDD